MCSSDLFGMNVAGDPASESTSIKWKDGMNLVKKAQQNGDAAGQKRKHSSLSRTFFQWFKDNTDPSADDIAEVHNNIVFSFSCFTDIVINAVVLPMRRHTLNTYTGHKCSASPSLFVLRKEKLGNSNHTFSDNVVNYI